MAKTINFQNAGKNLHKMSESEIREMVTKQADELLNSIPKEIRVAEVNAVQLESNLKEAADVGVWVQWTRACCDKRNIIQDFVDPAENTELGISSQRLENAVHQNHFDSNLSIRRVTEEESLKAIKEHGE